MPGASIVDHDARLAEAADDLETIAARIAAIHDAAGRITDPDAHAILLELRDSSRAVVRLAPAFGSAGLRAKARAILSPDLLDGSSAMLEVVLDGSYDTVELVQLFARDVLRLVPGTTNRPASTGRHDTGR